MGISSISDDPETAPSHSIVLEIEMVRGVVVTDKDWVTFERESHPAFGIIWSIGSISRVDCGIRCGGGTAMEG
ncbi:hypothetical protein A2U01_0045462 [Trifolium medium]|uniref:Uncharacterized protein n=1 Tax=Trifolium medium TaxID=97028 RepID=A0A392QK07_9FABA|nr:hypothetical protein [Trifolium medium]